MSPCRLASFREALPEDAPFIFNSWLKSARAQPLVSGVPQPLYYSGYKREVARLLSRSRAYVMCDPVAPEQIFSYLVCDRISDVLVIHFLYTKQVYRRMGFAKKLLSLIEPELATKGAIATSHTARLQAVTVQGARRDAMNDRLEATKDKYKIVYNPFVKDLLK